MGLFDFWKKDINKRKKKDLINAFNKALSKDQWIEVIKYGEELAQIFKNIGNRPEESVCYTGLGMAYRNL